MKKAVLYQKLAKSEVKCLACSWYCRIAPGNLGVCATRINKNGNLYSLTYGKAIGPEIDPVEKKPLYHFFPGSYLLSFGTVGCNFGCQFCQNSWHTQTNKLTISNYQLSINTNNKRATSEQKVNKIINNLSTTISPKEIVKLALENNCWGIAYTYNEPAIFAEFTHDTAKLAKKAGLKNVYVSNGFESAETFNYLKDYLDAINLDLKSFNADFYLNICKAKLDPVKQNIRKFFTAGIHTEVTTLIIPGFNDSEKELAQIAEFLFNISPDIPWHVTAFYPAYKMMDVLPTPPEKLVRAYDIGKNIGLKFVYVGNVEDKERSSTFCPKCRQLLILRDGYSIQIDNLEAKTGSCNNCGEKIYGVWS